VRKTGSILREARIRAYNGFLKTSPLVRDQIGCSKSISRIMASRKELG